MIKKKVIVHEYFRYTFKKMDEKFDDAFSFKIWYCFDERVLQ